LFEGYLTIESETKMIDVDDYVLCPVCGSKARAVYVSRDGKQCVVKCSQRHIHGSRSIKGLCFLVDYSEVKRIEHHLLRLRKFVGLEPVKKKNYPKKR